MRKLIIGASIILIIISTYGPLKAVFAAHQIKSGSPIAVAATPTPTPDRLLVSMTPVPEKLLASTTRAPDPIPQFTPASTPSLEPLKSRVVQHQPNQFRQGAISGEELLAINKALETIPWSRNSNPKVAANEDYAAIQKECEKSGVPGLLTDVITEAVSNDYQPNDEAANVAYSTELNAVFENNEQSGNSNGKTAAALPAATGTTVNSGLTPAVPANPTPSPSPSPTPAVAVRSKTVHHVNQRSTERHKTVDAKTRLIQLWHQSLAPKPDTN
jgi:hypothetical protein